MAKAYVDEETGIKVRSRDELTAGYFRRTRNMNDQQQSWELIETLCSKEDLKKIDKMSLTKWKELSARYVAFIEEETKDED